LRLASSMGLDESENKYYAIQAKDNAFPYFVDQAKEALQILHHAYIYDVEWVLLLIGDDSARVIAGIFVQFDTRLKEAWGKVIHDLYCMSISFLYESPTEPFNPSQEQTETLNRVLPTIKAAGASVDMHSFLQFVKIWRVIRLVWPKPLPPISKLIPLLFSTWNAMKGGSDTITKLIWSANYSPPCPTPQANGIARMFLLLFIQCHRSNQIATSKPSMPYLSLLHFRNANNKRFSLHETLLAICSCFGDDATETTEPETVSDDDDPFPTLELQGRSTRCNRPALQVEVNLPVITGATPKRSIRKTIAKLEDGTKNPKPNQMLVVDRVRNCCGFPIWSEETRGSCVVCGADTLWHCIGCHVNVCVNNISDEKKEKSKHEPFEYHQLDFTIAALPNSTAVPKRLRGVANTCYLLHHRAAIFKALGVSNKQD